MKRIFSVVCFFITCAPLMAQQEYFVFIQEASGQPFYVRIADESHSSSPGGHLLLSSLKDSTYNMFIGFPKNKYPEQLFILPLKRKDRGFELKYMNSGWQLFDLQTLDLIKPVAQNDKMSASLRKDDSYSKLMAGVVNDSAVLYNQVVMVEPEKKKDSEVVKPAVVVVEKNTEPVLETKVAEKEPETIAEKNPGTVPGENTTAVAEIKKPEVEAKAEEDVPDNIPAPAVDENSAEKKAGIIAEKKPDTVQEKKIESGTEKKAEVVAGIKKPKPEIKKPATVEEPVAKPDSVHVSDINSNAGRDRRDIIRFSTENQVDGKLIIYLDRTGPVTDTIRLLIPRL